MPTPKVRCHDMSRTRGEVVWQTDARARRATPTAAGGWPSKRAWHEDRIEGDLCPQGRAAGAAPVPVTGQSIGTSSIQDTRHGARLATGRNKGLATASADAAASSLQQAVEAATSQDVERKQEGKCQQDAVDKPKAGLEVLMQPLRVEGDRRGPIRRPEGME